MTTNLRDHGEMGRLAAEEATARARERMQMRASGQESWYITRRGRGFSEVRLNDLFEHHEIEYYLPKMRRMVKIPQMRLTMKQRKSGVTYKEPKLVPLLPSYLFVRFDRRRRDWRDVFIEAHIHGMMFSEEAGYTIPVVIRGEEIDRMKSLEVEGAIPEQTPIRQLGYAVGEEVRITGGSLVGFTAIIEEVPQGAISDVDEDVILRLTIWLFGRANLVELPLSAISKI